MNARILLGMVLLGLAGPVFAQNKGQLRIPEFAGLADKASESVNVTLDGAVLGMASKWLNSADPDQAKAKQLVSSLTGIYVRSYTFDTDFAYPKADVDGVRRQLSAPGWSRMVETHSNKENTDVDVYLLIEGGKAQGLAIIASEPRQFTIVNIVGSIDLEKLQDLEGNFGVPDLELETGAKPAAKPAEKPAPRPAPKS
jgi:hypothetical protein